jgi:hypothetical protein
VSSWPLGRPCFVTCWGFRGNSPTERSGQLHEFIAITRLPDIGEKPQRSPSGLRLWLPQGFPDRLLIRKRQLHAPHELQQRHVVATCEGNDRLRDTQAVIVEVSSSPDLRKRLKRSDMRTQSASSVASKLIII